jgi:hypothetical protein
MNNESSSTSQPPPPSDAAAASSTTASASMQSSQVSEGNTRRPRIKDYGKTARLHRCYPPICGFAESNH